MVKGHVAPRFLGLALAGFATILGGCASTHHFAVDAIRAPEVVTRPQTFCLTNADPFQAANLDSMTATMEAIRTTLINQGHHEAPAGMRADLEVEVAAGIERPRTVFRPRLEAMSSWDFAAGARPTRRIERATVFVKFLRITAHVPGKSAGRPAQLWSVCVTNADECPDLEPYLRPMTAVALDYLDADSTVKCDLADTARNRRVRIAE